MSDHSMSSLSDGLMLAGAWALCEMHGMRLESVGLSGGGWWKVLGKDEWGAKIALFPDVDIDFDAALRRVPQRVISGVWFKPY